jgi:hypothetical protein
VPAFASHAEADRHGHDGHLAGASMTSTATGHYRDQHALNALGAVMREFRLARRLTQEQVDLAGSCPGGCHGVERAKWDTRFLKWRRLLIALPGVEWPEVGRALQRVDPLATSDRFLPKFLSDMPRVLRPKGGIDGLTGIAMVVKAFRLDLEISGDQFRKSHNLNAGLTWYFECAQRDSRFVMVRRLVVALDVTWVEFCDALNMVDCLSDARDRARGGCRRGD